MKTETIHRIVSTIRDSESYVARMTRGYGKGDHIGSPLHAVPSGILEFGQNAACQCLQAVDIVEVEPLEHDALNTRIGESA